MSAVATIAAFVALWLVSVRLRDVSVIDVLWGPAFAIGPLVTLIADGVTSPRRLLVLSLVLLWGMRLGLHLWARNGGKPEDPRYAAMRAEHGERFVLRSLVTVFLLQAALVLVVSLPLRAVFAADAPRAITGLDCVAAAIVLAGIAIEALADAQLTRFRRDPQQEGKVLDSGLWRYSRHPNYFGDAVVWLGFGLFGMFSGGGLASVVGSVAGPLLMLVLLLRVSGVTLLEKTITTRRPDYARYVAETSAFVPWPPRR